MAVVGSFRHIEGTVGKRQPTTVECLWKTVDAEGSVLLQLDTYGSEDRAIPGKQSQTLQLDRAAAEELVGILRTTFPGIC